jgi:hypothetical protein
MKDEVFALYGYSGYDDPRCAPGPKSHAWKIDHLISKELGGADDFNNLWPEADGSSLYNAHPKSKLENRLNKEISEKKAQKGIAIAITGPDTSGVYPWGRNKHLI